MRVQKRCLLVWLGALLIAQPVFAAKTMLAETKRYQALAARPIDELITQIADSYPTIAAALRADATLPTELGDEDYAVALAQIALLVETKDPECIEALQIIGDARPRTSAPVKRIKINGRAREWRRAIPPPDSLRYPLGRSDRAGEIWSNGYAAVVRDDQLHLMIGLEDPAYFDQPNSRLYVTIDCIEGPEWDLVLHLFREKGKWLGQCGWLTRVIPGKQLLPLSIKAGAIDDVAEFCIELEEFLAAGEGKPIWTVHCKLRVASGQKFSFPPAKPALVFNESAAVGVEARWYVPNLVYLAADAGFCNDDRTALAIAIMAATPYVVADEAVRAQLRVDNARMLELARDLCRWQHAQKVVGRLDQYPLVAQLAWANRCVYSFSRFLTWNREHDARLDLEEYNWGFTSVDALKSFHQLARKEQLIEKSTGVTAKRIDQWVSGQAVARTMLEAIPALMERHKDNPKKLEFFREQIPELKRRRATGEDVVGHFKGEPIYEITPRSTKAYLKLLQEHGQYYGGCVDHAWITLCMFQAVGIAPLGMGVAPSRSVAGGHVWTAYYDPGSRRWKSPHVARSGDNWWWFGAGRLPVYPSAAFAPLHRGSRTLPFPYYYWQEMQGRKIARICEHGIPQGTLRRFMLTASQ